MSSGSCTVTPNSTIAPDGNQTADTVTAVTGTPVIQQQIARLADGGTYTFSWQRFKIAGTLAASQTGLWIVVRQYAPNGATTGPPATSTSGAPASSRAMTPGEAAPVPGPLRHLMSLPALPAVPS